MIKNDYVQPTMKTVELQHGTHILQYSRSNYGRGGDGYSDSNVSDRTGYDDGVDGWGDANVSNRSGYGFGGDGWD
jgi:hypothetical protein